MYRLDQKEVSKYSYGSMDYLYWQLTYVDENKNSVSAEYTEILTRNEWQLVI